jgi:hypothetical protein
MSDSVNLKYWFGFRVIIPEPPGEWIIIGPFDTYLKARIERDNTKAVDCEVTPPFVAETEEEAKTHPFVK